MRPVATVADWLAKVAAERAGSVALAGLDRPDLSYLRLVEQVDGIARQLRSRGVRRGDVIVIAVSDGPEALVAMLGAISVGTAFPVGTSEQPERYERLFAEVAVRAVICDARLAPSLRAASAAHGIVPFILSFDPNDPAGVFTLASDDPPMEAGLDGAPPTVGDPALLIATSGSTAAPKIVAVSHESLFHSVVQFSEALGLSPDDRSLCVMPLTHLHSLLRSILPGLFAGGSVICTRGFSQREVLGWIARLRPTYITGAPSIHRSLLRAAREAGWQPGHAPALRLLVTGSDTIDAATVDGLAATFDVPLFQFYVLSETAPVIAMTTREDAEKGPILRVSAPWSVACVDDHGSVLPAGAEGEIAVVGGVLNPLVAGANPIDRRLTKDGRLLTGDLGTASADGVVSITGRIDDRIQRGGEKISPSAVEEILLQHPDVRQAAVFGVPDASLGQRVAAAIVINDGGTASASDVQMFLAGRLSGYMVPEKIVIVGQLPTSDVGKVLPRSRLATALELVPEPVPEPVPAPIAASAPAEKPVLHASLADAEPALTEIFRARLKLADADREASFFDLGGDSFGAIEMLIEIEDRFGVRVPPAVFAGHPSVSSLADYFRREGRRRVMARILPVRAEGRMPPLFVAYNIGGDVGYGTAMAEALGPEQPLYATYTLTRANEAAPPERIEEQAADLVEAIRSVQAHGPYHLIGYSFGAHLALEIAQQFLDAGETIAFLGVIDDSADLERRRFNTENERAGKYTTMERNKWALRRYVPKPYPGHITLFRSTEPVDLFQSDPFAGWGDIAMDGVEAHDIEGDHASIVTAKGFRWGPQLSLCLAKARHRSRSQGVRPGPEAAKALRRARSLTSSKTARNTVEARLAAKRGDYKTEIKEYRKALQLDPAQPLWVRRNLAEALIGEGNLDAGFALFEAAISLDPWPLLAMGRFIDLLLLHKRVASAEAVYHRARELVAEDPDTQRHWGHICRLVGRREEAEAAFRRAITLESRKSYGQGALEELHAQLSDLLAVAGRTADALTAANEALKLNPNEPKNRRRATELMTRATALAV